MIFFEVVLIEKEILLILTNNLIFSSRSRAKQR